MSPTLTLSTQPDPALIRALHGALLDFNNAASGYPYDASALVISMTDHDSGDVIGGLFGATAYGYLRVDMLFVPESLRGQGFGSQLMRQSEEEAIRRGCHGAYLDTFDFQARGFYERLGYSVLGSLPDCPTGHTRFFMQKKLA
jgi:GNAT superfamily N-acetyltransferase